MRYSVAMDETTARALRSIAQSHRSLADSLEEILQLLPAEPSQPRSLGLPPTAPPAASADVWDPETDPPLVSPKVVGTVAEQDWCSLTYLAGIYAINKRHGRGANAAEIREYAIKAGYQDGRAVTAWSKGSGPTYNDQDKRRWITPEGVDHWVRRLAKKYGVTLPPDLAEPWEGRTPEFDGTPE